MANIAQTIKQGDTGPSLTTTIKINGIPPPDPAVSPNEVVEVYLRKDGESCFSIGAGNPVVVTDSATWAMRYDRNAVDTDTPGIMAVEWRFTQGNPTVPHTAPSGGYDLVRVLGRDDC